MFDGELPAAECELLARRLTRDEVLRSQWSRYSLIGAALRAERGVTLHDRVAWRVQSQVAQEASLRRWPRSIGRHLAYRASVPASDPQGSFRARSLDALRASGGRCQHCRWRCRHVHSLAAHPGRSAKPCSPATPAAESIV